MAKQTELIDKNNVSLELWLIPPPLVSDKSTETGLNFDRSSVSSSQTSLSPELEVLNRTQKYVTQMTLKFCPNVWQTRAQDLFFKSDCFVEIGPTTDHILDDYRND